MPHEIHHARCHNTKVNRRRYPLFVDSLFNLVAVNHDWHMMYPSWGKWSERQVAWFERRLAASPDLCRKVCCAL